MSTLPSFEVHTLPRSLVVDPPLSDAELEAFCLENDWVQVERTREGVIRMNPPTGGETSSAHCSATRSGLASGRAPAHFARLHT